LSLRAEDEALVQSLVGRTVIRAEWFDACPDYDWAGHEVARLCLDDGRVIEFSAWGYDAWGAAIREVEASSVESK
jgi:hypothetical protein